MSLNIAIRLIYIFTQLKSAHIADLCLARSAGQAMQISCALGQQLTHHRQTTSSRLFSVKANGKAKAN